MAKKQARDVEPQVDEDISTNLNTNEESVEATSQDEPAQIEGEEAVSTAAPKIHHRFWHWIVAHKRISVPVMIVIILVILSAIPFTRYALAGTVLKQSFTVKVLDQETQKPVTSADVTLAGKTVKTDNKGQAALKVKVGPSKLSIQKKYYEDASRDVTVPILKQKDVAVLKVKATGRQVSVTVSNAISGKPVPNAKVTALGTEAKTGKDGVAVLVLPADKQTVEATLSAPNFNTTKSTVKVTASPKLNVLNLTPAGKVYFLSNRDGNIDVVKTNLDGTDRQMVLAGTGKEDRYQTVLLASRDWKYLALYSKRDGGEKPKLFLINTSTDRLTTMDEGDADFELIGWSDHRFLYKVTRNKQLWEPNREALKSFNAEDGHITTLDQSGAEYDGAIYIYEFFHGYNIVDGKLIYATTWRSNVFQNLYYYNLIPKQPRKMDSIRVVGVDGKDKKDLKTFDNTSNPNIDARLYEPKSVEFAFSILKDYEFYEYEGGGLKQIQTTIEKFYNTPYPTHLQSPSGSKTLWSESRDGKNTIFVGDDEGKGEQSVAAIEGSQVFGWFTDDYVLVSKKGSELYILPSTAGSNKSLKITDYYKPDYSISGYGGGYGGL